ncbi:glutathione S-transferase family protein [Altererythrobacter xixiisoli]|uniref:Glutathione S-transferase family protein n=1 Tax=Croceibacterium xixiisoli TaxID=1476466 RepID=A0A6I4TV04_9SPHN|nr:glutathione S-transferase family protein [Croceibacterium xixiisoli]MXO98398.1 glutathione S-transferase family protein [Croceibacterium xixiisoli]
MLTLYSFGPGANSLKPLLTLYEKQLDFTPRFLDPRQFEQHADWYKAINPRGQVPALDHDSNIVTESTVICEYLEDVFPDALTSDGAPLRPADPYQVAQMRVWTKWVDEYFCWCVSTIGWAFGIRDIARQMSDQEFEDHLKNVPIPEQQVKWRRARDGFPQDILDEEFRKVRVSVERLEQTLSRQDYLLEGGYSLADICNFAIANGMNREGGYFADFVNPTDTPGLIAWLQRINERPAVQRMFAQSRSEFSRPQAATQSA